MTITTNNIDPMLIVYSALTLISIIMLIIYYFFGRDVSAKHKK